MSHDIELVTTFPNGMQVEVREDWDDQYRLRLNDRVTAWGRYNSLLAIDDQIAIAPHYTGEANWILVTLEEAIKLVVVGEISHG